MRRRRGVWAGVYRFLGGAAWRNRTSAFKARRRRLLGTPDPLESRALLAINPFVYEEVESNNTTGTANTLSIASNSTQAVVGRISAGDSDYFKFSVPAGAKVWAYTDTGAARNVSGSSNDTVLTLFSTNGTTSLFSGDDGAQSNGGDDTVESTRGSLIPGVTVASAGTYFLRVTAFSNTSVVDPYKLFISITVGGATFESFTSNGTSSTAETIDPASPLRGGSITTADVDFYSFHADAGDQVVVYLDANPLRVSNNDQMNLGMYGPFATSLMSSVQSSSGSTKGTAINLRLTTSGTYYVRLSKPPTSSDVDYSLLVQVGRAAKYYEERTGNNDGAPNAQSILSPTVAPLVMVGSLTSGDTMDTYSFYAPAGMRLWAFAETGGMKNQEIPTTFVRDVGLAVLRQNSEGLFETIAAGAGGGTGAGDDDVAETTESASIYGTRLDREGIYYVNVLRGNASINDNTKVVSPYRLFLYLTGVTGTNEVEPNNASSQADPIGSGNSPSVREGFLSTGDQDWYSVDLKPGEIVWMIVNGDPIPNNGISLDADLSFFAPDGTTRLGLTAGPVDWDSSTVPITEVKSFEAYSYRAIVSGRYFIRVGLSGSADRSYQLMASIVSPYNLAPIVDNTGSPYAILGVGSRQSTAMLQGKLVSEILATGAGGQTVLDGDMSFQPGIAITAVDSSLGNLQYTLVTNNPAESDWKNVTQAGAVSDTSALLLPPTARLRFSTTRIPHHDTAAVFLPIGSKLDNAFTFRGWDQSGGTAGQRGNASANGGSTAFSAATETVTVYFEARLFRHFNRNASLNVYTLEAEFNALSGGGAFEDRSTDAWTGFTVLLSPVPQLGTAALYRMYYGIQFNTNGSEIDMGYRYLTSNLSEAQVLETLGPVDKRDQRLGSYFRELGVSAGSAILGYVFTAQQTGTQALVQIYRTDIVQKPTRPPGTAEGSTPTSFTPQENGDHVYTTNTSFETGKTGTWRVESSRGFVRPLGGAGVISPATAAPAMSELFAEDGNDSSGGEVLLSRLLAPVYQAVFPTSLGTAVPGLGEAFTSVTFDVGLIQLPVIPDESVPAGFCREVTDFSAGEPVVTSGWAALADAESTDDLFAVLGSAVDELTLWQDGK